MNAFLAGLGTAVPQTQVNQEETYEAAIRLGAATYVPPERVKRLYEQAGIHTRHTIHTRAFFEDLWADTRHSGSVFLPGHEDGPTTAERMIVYAAQAGPLALAAAREAMNDAAFHCQAEQVTHLVLVSCTGFAAPGVDHDLINGLNLSPIVERIHIGFMGCHGAINGLRTAQALCALDRSAVVLMVAVELCTLHHFYRPNLEQTISNALFADGAAAAVVVGSEVVQPSVPRPWAIAGTASRILPGTAEQMSWTIGDHGFFMSLGRGVSGKIREHLPSWLPGLLQKYGLSDTAAASWAIHPGGPRIVEACAEALKLPAEALEASRAVLARYGNMSSATVLFVWQHWKQQVPNQQCVLLAFGPGLTAEVALLSPG